MDNIITYVKFRQDVTFKTSPFSEADAMVLSAITGLNYEGLIQDKMTIQELAKAYKEKGIRDTRDGVLHDKETLLYLVAGSKRYAKLKVSNYVRDIDEEKEMTFYAITFSFSFREVYVCFRGTDGTMLSWKENFVSIYTMPTVGQMNSVKYLSKVAAKPFSKVNVIGHSKGGNLAVYAAMCVEEKLQKRINNVYAFDAPGYAFDISDKLGYLRIKDRIKAYVPKGCVIGNLMNPPYERTVVNASGKSVYQHNIFNWEIDITGLCPAGKTLKNTDDVSKKANDWINSVSKEDGKRVVDELFDMFKENGILHISDLMDMDLKQIIHIVRCLKSLSSENRELLGIIIRQLSSRH